VVIALRLVPKGLGSNPAFPHGMLHAFLTVVKQSYELRDRAAPSAVNHSNWRGHARHAQHGSSEASKASKEPSREARRRTERSARDFRQRSFKQSPPAAYTHRAPNRIANFPRFVTLKIIAQARRADGPAHTGIDGKQLFALVCMLGGPTSLHPPKRLEAHGGLPH
jgi:hypothetical protein